MQRYTISQFDNSTFVVLDKYENREVCVCSNYQEWTDAEKRAHYIVAALNQQANYRSKSIRRLSRASQAQ